jgi:hypothetical protein
MRFALRAMRASGSHPFDALGSDAAEEEVKILRQTVGHKPSILPILIEHP